MEEHPEPPENTPRNEDKKTPRILPHIKPRSQPQSAPVEITADNVEKHIHRKEQRGKLKLPNGDVYDITIPAPDEDDIEWAKESFTEDADWRLKQASMAIIDGNLWRLQFLLAVNQQQEGFLDINGFGDKDNDYTLLGHTTLEDDRTDFAALLLSYGADLEIGGSPRWNRTKTRKYTPVGGAVENDQLEILELLLNNGAQFYKEDFEAADHPATKAYLVARFEDLDDGTDVRNLNSPAKHNSKWALLDDFTIAKTSTLPGKMRLTKIFNFLSQEIEKVTEMLEADGDVKNVSHSPLQSFDDVAHKEEIKQAHAKLLEKGGTPEAIETYTRSSNTYSARGNRPSS
ncbi:MAG: hypothetical protein HND56_04600 [Pseudomonadota bacterium]|nr:hypothetical protein [Pseudomonadota bacterium]QKK05014.1 MAG: hypothetical protein HND56_04600 [Pseudomonadota bacterium]